MSVRLYPTATVVLGLTALLLASVALGRAETGSPARIKFDQGELDEDEKISPAVEAKVARVLRRNLRLLGAHPIDFCRRMPPDERKGCLATVEQIEAVEIGDIVKVRENSDLSDGGREWPNAAAVSGFR